MEKGLVKILRVSGKSFSIVHITYLYLRSAVPPPVCNVP